MIHPETYPFLQYHSAAKARRSHGRNSCLEAQALLMELDASWLSVWATYMTHLARLGEYWEGSHDNEDSRFASAGIAPWEGTDKEYREEFDSKLLRVSNALEDAQHSMAKVVLPKLKAFKEVSKDAFFCMPGSPNEHYVRTRALDSAVKRAMAMLASAQVDVNVCKNLEITPFDDDQPPVGGSDTLSWARHTLDPDLLMDSARRLDDMRLDSLRPFSVKLMKRVKELGQSCEGKLHYVLNTLKEYARYWKDRVNLELSWGTGLFLGENSSSDQELRGKRTQLIKELLTTMAERWGRVVKREGVELRACLTEAGVMAPSDDRQLEVLEKIDVMIHSLLGALQRLAVAQSTSTEYAVRQESAALRATMSRQLQSVADHCVDLHNKVRTIKPPDRNWYYMERQMGPGEHSIREYEIWQGRRHKFTKGEVEDSATRYGLTPWQHENGTSRQCPDPKQVVDQCQSSQTKCQDAASALGASLQAVLVPKGDEKKHRVVVNLLGPRPLFGLAELGKSQSTALGTMRQSLSEVMHHVYTYMGVDTTGAEWRAGQIDTSTRGATIVVAIAKEILDKATAYVLRWESLAANPLLANPPSPRKQAADTLELILSWSGYLERQLSQLVGAWSWDGVDTQSQEESGPRCLRCVNNPHGPNPCGPTIQWCQTQHGGVCSGGPRCLLSACGCGTERPGPTVADQKNHGGDEDEDMDGKGKRSGEGSGAGSPHPQAPNGSSSSESPSATTAPPANTQDTAFTYTSKERKEARLSFTTYAAAVILQKNEAEAEVVRLRRTVKNLEQDRKDSRQGKSSWGNYADASGSPGFSLSEPEQGSATYGSRSPMARQRWKRCRSWHALSPPPSSKSGSEKGPWASRSHKGYAKRATFTLDDVDDARAGRCIDEGLGQASMEVVATSEAPRTAERSTPTGGASAEKLYRYRRSPMGLATSPATFSRSEGKRGALGCGASAPSLPVATTVETAPAWQESWVAAERAKKAHIAKMAIAAEAPATQLPVAITAMEAMAVAVALPEDHRVRSLEARLEEVEVTLHGKSASNDKALTAVTEVTRTIVYPDEVVKDSMPPKSAKAVAEATVQVSQSNLDQIQNTAAQMQDQYTRVEELGEQIEQQGKANEAREKERQEEGRANSARMADFGDQMHGVMQALQGFTDSMAKQKADAEGTVQAEVARREAALRAAARGQDDRRTAAEEEEEKEGGGGKSRALAARGDRGFQLNNGLGQGGNEGGAFQLGSQLEADMIKAGNNFMGNKQGVNLYTKCNKELHGITGDAHYMAVVRGVVDKFEEDPKLKKQIWKSATKDASGWNVFVTTFQVVAERELTYVRTMGGANKYSWAAEILPAHVASASELVMERSKVECQIERDQLAMMKVDKFVQDGFQRGFQSEVLGYMKEHFRTLADAERECWKCGNLVILRQWILTRDFIEKGVPSTPMWKHKLMSNPTDHGASTDGRGITATAAQRMITDAVATAMQTKSGKVKGAAAPRGGHYRFSDTPLHGGKYTLNGGKSLHTGSVCDHCEKTLCSSSKKPHMAGSNCYHHPLRCPLDPRLTRLSGGTGWLPENNNVKTWTKRDGTTATLK